MMNKDSRTMSNKFNENNRVAMITAMQFPFDVCYSYFKFNLLYPGYAIRHHRPWTMLVHVMIGRLIPRQVIA